MEITEIVKEEEIGKDVIRFGIGVVLFVIAMFFRYNDLGKVANLAIVFFILSYVIVGGEVIGKALRNILNKELFDENFLMAIATIGAFLIGEFAEAVAVMLFYQLGEIFQSYAVNHSRKSIANLMDIKPEYANVERDGILEKVSPTSVLVGEIIVVKPGEKVPLDGIIVLGSSFMDTKALTGEPVPRKVSVGDTVLSGCINQEQVLKLKVTCLEKESTVHKILDLVENASSKKAETEHFITKFARIYTPIVVGLAFLLAILPPIITNTSFSICLYRALSFLVVSCPCALVISIPLSFFGGIGASARNGILVKGSNYLEAMSQVSTMVFDKTGTLTEGVFEVQEMKPSTGVSKEYLLETAALAEFYSNHPIANSVKKAYGNSLDKSKVGKVQELPGLGIEAIINKQKVLVGNEKLMEKFFIPIEKCKKVGTILYVAIDKKYVGYILIADKIKDTTLKAISSLKDQSITDLVMLTGDRLEIGKSVAKKVGISSVHAELLPNEKVLVMEKILKEKHANSKVAFVGDGMNDAPVLAIADIGISMGGVGSDAAIEASDIVIMTDDLLKISKLIKISKKTLRIVKQNISLAIFIKVLVLCLSALGLSTMWMAVFADVGVSVLAILNALRLIKIKY